MLRSLPKVGVDAALCKVMEEMEEELSARAKGAKGGGLPETGGLKGRFWRQHILFKQQNKQRRGGRTETEDTSHVPGL